MGRSPVVPDVIGLDLAWWSGFYGGLKFAPLSEPYKNMAVATQ